MPNLKWIPSNEGEAGNSLARHGKLKRYLRDAIDAKNLLQVEISLTLRDVRVDSLRGA